MFIASLNRLIAKLDTTGSADKRNGMVLVCLAHLVLRKIFMLLKHTYIESRRPTWLPQNNYSWNIQRNWYFATEMTSSFLVSKVSFTCWKVQNLFFQIWTSITLDPVDRTWLNFQEIFPIDHSNNLWNFIELFWELTNLLAKQKGYQFNWDTV